MGKNDTKVEVSYVSPQKNKITFSIKKLLLALIVLILIIITLNYFNFISLSAIYQPLSFLPRQQTKQIAVTPAPKNYTSTVLSYDVEKAKILLKKYVKDTVKPDLLPADFDKMDIHQSPQDPNIFSLFFDAPTNDKITVFFRYEKSKNIINSFGITIRLENNKVPTATGAALANSIFNKYFINPLPISSCRVDAKPTLCDTLQTYPENKIGYGIMVFNTPTKYLDRIYVCLIPKESKNYNSAKSCTDY